MEEKVMEENGKKYLTVETLRSFGVRQQCLFMSTQNILFLQISVQKTFGFVLPSLNHTFCWTRKSFCRCVMISKLIPRKIRGPYKQWFEKLYNLVQCEQAIICKWRIILLYGKKKELLNPVQLALNSANKNKNADNFIIDRILWSLDSKNYT